MSIVESQIKLIVSVDDGVIVPVDKIAHVARQGDGVRIYLLSYGFVDLAVFFDDLVEQLIGAY